MKNFQDVTGSSSIKSYAVEYNSDSNLLTIEFTGGSKYTYAEVPSETIQEFAEAESKGKYFAAHIKDKFLTEKVGDTSAFPFPTGPKPVESDINPSAKNANLEEYLEWTPAEEEEFLKIVGKNED